MNERFGTDFCREILKDRLELLLNFVEFFVCPTFFDEIKNQEGVKNNHQ